MNQLLKALGKGYRAVAPGARGGRFGGAFGGIRGRGMDGVDVSAEAGARIDSSVVYPAVAYGCKQILKTRARTLRPEAQTGRLVEVPDHPITLLLNQPMPWTPGANFLTSVLTSMMISGQGYALKRRSGASRLKGLEYLPLGCMWPQSTPGSGKFIDFYWLSVPGGSTAIEPDDVLHLRWLPVNPWNPGLGFSPLESCLPEIVSDKRAARYEAAMLRNAHKMHLGAPSGKDDEGYPLTFGEAQRREFALAMNEAGTQDASGGLLMMPYPIQIQQMGFSPADMALEHQHNLSEERVAAAFGIPARELGFGTGLEQSNNRASSQTTKVDALFNFTVPMLTMIAEQLTHSLVPELGMPGDVVRFDLDLIPEYRDYRSLSDIRDAGGPTQTVNEVRERNGDDPIEGGESLRASSVLKAAEKGEPDEGPEEEEPPAKKRPTKR